MSTPPTAAPLLSRPLSLCIIVASVMLALSSGLLWSAQKQLEHAQREQANARSKAQALHQRYLQAQSDEARIRETIASFDQYRSQGLIGPENRLDWAMALRDIGQARRIAKLDFTLAPQREISKLDPAGLFTQRASLMKLSMQSLHEGDVLRVLDDLRQTPGLLIQPRQCSLSTLPESVSNDGISAECELDWITVSMAADALKKP